MPTFVLHGSDDSSHRQIDYAKELNQEQLEVVLHGDGPCLVLAGAGSGKTRTVTYRVAYLLEHGVDPSSILLLTFTNKASREMLERVSRLLGGEARGIWGGTFHSVANRLLRSNANHIGYPPGFTILDQEDARALIKAVLKDLQIDPKARRFPSAAVVQDLISYSRNVMQPLAEVLEIKHPNFLSLAGEIEEVARLYDARKRAGQSMDFDDLLVNWLALVEHPQIGEAMSRRFQYVLVDEYQDTNALQSRIVKGIAQVHKNVLVVGDDAQSIYAFRGADVKNILNFPDRWEDAKIFKLLTNYRSVPEILELANDSLSHNIDQFEKELVGVRPNGKKPLVVPTASARQEAQYIAEQILALRAEGVALGNMAVLFRSSAHSQALEFELVKRDIPYEYRGGMKFFGRAHIKDVLAHLRVIQNPHDESAWLRVLNIQQGIGATTASTLAAQAHTFPDTQQIIEADLTGLLPARAKGGWDALTSSLRQALVHPTDPGAMIEAIIASPYQEYLEREYPDFRDRLEDLEQLEQFAQNYKDLASFLADISLYDDVVAGQERAGGGDEEHMVLSTIHQAKGLEWDTVFVIHLADNAFPSSRALDQEDGLEEERRLFYVAVTRARQRLFLTYPMTTGYDALMFNRPSTFLEELSPRLTERMEVRDGMRPVGGGSSSRRSPGDSWNFDEPFSDDGEVITLDRRGERSRPSSPQTGTVVWKSSGEKREPPKKSFLRDVGEL